MLIRVKSVSSVGCNLQDVREMAGFAGVLSGSNHFKAQGFSTNGLPCVVGGKDTLLSPAFSALESPFWFWPYSTELASRTRSSWQPEVLSDLCETKESALIRVIRGLVQ